RELKASAGLQFGFARVDFGGFDANYRLAALPLSVTWDTRDKELDPRDGHYIAATATPFLGFGTTGSGAQVTLDARGYRTFGRYDGLVLERVAMGGSVVGAGLPVPPPDYLFSTGGEVTVSRQF